MRRLTILISLAATAMWPAAAAAQHEHAATPERLGKVHFETSCSKDVAPAFDRAMALLHSFGFGTARQGFEDVAAKDPSCAMAHWGIAMSEWGNPFAGIRGPQSLPRGQAAVDKARAAKPKTDRERAYIDAVAELYKDYQTVDQRTRTLAYESAMEKVYRAYPKDTEAAAFYALSVNQDALPTDKTYANQLKAAAILEKLWAQQPEHPGFAHYLIHAYDTPALADRAVKAARRYAQIAPSAPHALHMPSHTFTRLGYWQESIDSNIASAETAKRDGVFGEALHAMDYEVYAYLQTGQDGAARKLVDEAPGIVPSIEKAVAGAAPSSSGFYAAGTIPARYALERGAWSDAARLPFRTSNFPWIDAVTRFARSVGAARAGNYDAALADASELDTLQKKLADAKDTYWAEQVRIQREVASAWMAFAQGQKDTGVALLRRAADAEDATDKSAISPGPLAPAREMLGEMLLAMNRPVEALAALEAVMKKEPNRFRATFYGAKAAAASGNQALARKYYAKVVEICAKGDKPGRPELEEARRSGS